MVMDAEQKGLIRAATGVEKGKLFAPTYASAEADIIKDYRESLAKGEVTQGLETMATGLPANWKERARQVVLTDVDPATGDKRARNAAETTTLNAVIKHTEVYEQFQRRGFDGLMDDPAGPGSMTKKDKQDFIQAQVENFILNNPMLHEAYKNSRGVIEPAVITAMLRDKQLAARLSENLAASFDNGVMANLTSAEQAFVTAEGEWKAAQSALDSATTERQNINDSLTNAAVAGGVANREVAFMTDAYTSINGRLGGGVSNREDVLTDLMTDPIVTKYFDAVDEADINDKKFRETPPANRADRDHYRFLRDNANATIAAINADPGQRQLVAEAFTLRKSKNEIAAARTAAEARIPALDAQIGTLQNERNVKAAAKAAAETTRNGLRDQLVADVDGALEHAGNDVMLRKISENIEGLDVYKQRLAEEAAAAKTEAERAAAEAKTQEQATAVAEITRYLDSRYIDRTQTAIMHREVTRVNRTHAETDFRTLTGPDGPTNLMNAALVAAVPDAAMRGRLLADPTFVQQETTRAVARCMQAYTAAGLPVDLGTLNALTLTDWGKTAVPQWTKDVGSQREMIAAGMNGAKANTFAELFSRRPVLGLLGLVGILTIPYILARARQGNY